MDRPLAPRFQHGRSGWRSRMLHPLALLGLGTLLVVAALWIATFRLIDAQYGEADRSMAREVQDLADVYEAQVLRAARELARHWPGPVRR